MPVIVIGAGQAGLATSFFLKSREIKHLVLDAAPEIAHAWRSRRPDMRLRTASAASSLPGLRLPEQDARFPTAAVVAQYLDLYAHTFSLPVMLNRRVQSLRRNEQGFDLTIANTVTGELEHRHTPVAVWAGGAHALPVSPPFAPRLPNDILQLTALSYRGAQHLPDGPVVVVGAGNSGIEIAVDIAKTRRGEVYLAGAAAPGPTRVGTSTTRPQAGAERRPPRIAAALRSAWLSAATRRRGSEEPALPRIELADSATIQVGRVTGAAAGGLLIDDGTTIACSTVIWCTGFVADHSWLHLPVNPLDHISRHGESMISHGFYAVGVPRRTSSSSHLLGGVGRDAERTVDHLVSHALFRTGGPVPGYDFPVVCRPPTTTRKAP